MISVKCPKPNCHNHTQVNEIFIGRPVRCSKCGSSFVIKSPPSAPRSAPRPAEPMPLAAQPEIPAAFAQAPPLESADGEAQPLSELNYPETEWLEDADATEADSGGWPAPPMLDDLNPDPLTEDGASVEDGIAGIEAGASEIEAVSSERGGSVKLEPI